MSEADARIGKRMRELRRAANLSQSALGEQIGVSFQQVQKYERGANRVSAVTLWQAAKVLGRPITYFFEDE